MTVVPRGPKRWSWPLLLRLSVGALFVGAAVCKLAGAQSMVAVFAAIGAGQWFRYAVGLCELFGAALLVTPRLGGLGAILLSGVMVGAIATQLFIVKALRLFVIGSIVITASPLVPVLVLILLIMIAWLCRADTAEVVTRIRSVLLHRSKRRREGYEPS